MKKLLFKNVHIKVSVLGISVQHRTVT